MIERSEQAVTLTYGEQQSVSAPKLAGAGFTWRTDDDPRVGGFSSLTLNIAPAFATSPSWLFSDAL